MEDLVVWLRRQFDDDERVAKAAARGASGRWRRREGDDAGVELGVGDDDWPDDESSGIVVYDEGRPTVAQAEHIARYDPARVLRDVNRDRLLLDFAERSELGYLTKVLALPYKDRPGFREEWRP